MLKKLCICFIACLAAFSVKAQFQGDVYRQYNNAKVTTPNSVVKKLAWAGGMNNPQFCMADLNNDGRRDLVVYERDYYVKTFIATSNGEYIFDNSYAASFDGKNVNGYLKLIDFNQDRIPDMFHYHYSGVGIFHGYYDKNVLKFKYYKELRYMSAHSGSSNIYVNPMDIPGFADLDNDGDIDIVSYAHAGNTITLFKNCQIEEGLPNDSFKVCVEDDCWGKTIQYFERTHGLAHSCLQEQRTCNKVAKTTHVGNSFCFIDMDNDGDKDYFNGNVSFSDIQYLENGRIPYSPKKDTIISQDTLWSGGGKQMSITYFPAAFAEDVDHDGMVDLLFSPIGDNSAEYSENYKCAVYYKNTGTPGTNTFTYQSDSFLVGDMIDLGTGSYPVFYDYDKDGLKDLFIGSDGYFRLSDYSLRSRISYYRNTSTGSGYSFELQTGDFLGLSAMNWEGAALAIGDIDNDSLDDLIIGKTDGTFSFFKNKAATKNDPPIWYLHTANLKDNQSAKTLDVGYTATPAIYDINNDGINDLISGNQSGDLYYFENNTIPSVNITFKEVTKNFGGVTLYDPDKKSGYSAPYIGPMDNSGKDYLVIGSYQGQLFRYDGFQNGAMPAQLNMVDSNYSYISGMARLSPAFANVNNDADNLYELVIGNQMGGVFFYKQDFKVYVDDKFGNDMELNIYPNPASGILNISWNSNATNEMLNIDLISVTGQHIMSYSFSAADKRGSINISELSSGTYYCIVNSGGNRLIKPVTVLN